MPGPGLGIPVTPQRVPTPLRLNSTRTSVQSGGVSDFLPHWEHRALGAIRVIPEAWWVRKVGPARIWAGDRQARAGSQITVHVRVRL